MAMDVIDYEILGEELQYVEVELAPGEAVVGASAGLYYLQDDVRAQALNGELASVCSLFVNHGTLRRKLAFAAPTPGRVLALHLLELGGALCVQPASFLAGAKGLSLGPMRDGAGLGMRQLDGDGYLFLHVAGGLSEQQLHAGEVLRVAAGCVVACQPGVGLQAEQLDLADGASRRLVRLSGPGRVWLQAWPA